MTSQEKIEEHPFVDIFNEDEAEKDFMLSKPVCFIVFGKPGVGKSTLAYQIAQAWKCIRVEASTILEEQIASETESGVMLQSMLVSGHSAPDELVTKLMLEKLNSLEVSHFGYIITEIPSLSQDAMNVLQQIELIRNLDLKPDIIINIKCPDFDLCQRISGQRQHSTTGYIYTREQWDPEIIGNRRKKKRESHKEGKGEEELEEEEEQEEEEAIIAEMQMVAEILQHLVQRPEDYLENIEHVIKLYKETILHALEEVMAEHNSRFLIELDGNKPPEELFMTVMDRLKYLNLRRAAILTKLQSAEEEMNENIENDELFRALASYKLIAPRYRWHRSRWGQTCPVSLKEGNIHSGSPDFSVSFLGKMYCMSSEEAFKKFLLNPRPYLLPPMPAPPFKVFIFGPQSSGKTTLSNLLAEHYKGKVVDYATLVQPRFDKALETLKKNTIAEATEAAIKVVKERLLAELEARKQALRELEADYEMKKYGMFPSDKSIEEVQSSIDEEFSHDSRRESSLDGNEEAKMKSGEGETSKTSMFKRSAQDISQDPKLESKKGSIEDSIEEVTADHPEVISIMKDTMKMTKDMNFEQPYEKQAEILAEVLDEVVEENKNRFSGAPKYGGWILDNCPVVKELWTVLVEKGITPDLVICLSNTENNGKYLLNRLYLENKPEIDSKIFERLFDELQKKKKEEEATRKAKEEVLRIEEENRRLLEAMNVKAKEVEETEPEVEEEFEVDETYVPEGSEALEVAEEMGALLPEESEATEVPEREPESVFEPTEETTVVTEIPKESIDGLEPKLSETVVLPEFPEDAYPDVPEMDPIKEKIKSFSSIWKYLEMAIAESFVQVFILEIADKTPEQLLQKVVETMEKPFQYTGWELNIDDYDEETEDYQAEAEIDEDVEEEEEEEEEPSDVQFTEEEEAIRLNLMENEPLPPEILEAILSEWWFKEPIRSTGFILDGFPRYPEEVQFLGERGFFPDAALFIQVDDQDVSDRLLPPQMEKWKLKQKKKFERKKLIKEMKAKIKDDMISKRRAELIAEREKKKKGEVVREDEEISEEEPEDDDDDIDNILEDEFPKDEEVMSEEDEEQEADALERLRGELGEKFEADISNLQIIQEEFEKCLIPVIIINGARKLHIVQYMLNKKLKPLVENRASIFEKCYPISLHLAQKMLNFTYKHISTFGYWDPVKLSEGEITKPIENTENAVYPVIHRQYIYFLSSKHTKEKFMKNPIKYIRQPKPKPTVPIRIAIVGPPRSGKTTVAHKFSSEYGLKCLSIGEALRYILTNQPNTELALMLNWHLHKGMIAPDELAIKALEISLMESICNTAGVVIDGYPVTGYQMSLLEARSIIPMAIFELDVPSKEIFRRLLLEKKKEQSLPYPLHNSTQIIAVRNSKYHKNIVEIKQYYQEQHQNWYVIDGFHSKWWVWNEVSKHVQMVNKYVQIYLEKIQAGKAACIDKLCITPQELNSRLGEFRQFCPVSLAESYELVDCSVTESLEFAAEFRGHYYKMSSQEKMNKFLENPELYVPPLAPHPLPSADMIPKRLTLSELKKRFPKCAELQGYCPVTYQDGKQRYEALVPGNIKYALEYRDRIYICESSEKLQKFLRLPLKYWNQKLPHKLPPLKEPIYLTSLPLPGYLEQGIATSLIKAMNAAGCLKPKFPFLSVKRSALLYVAFHLKAFNPKGSEYTRKKYKKKMEQFMERCELITYLGAKMTRKYKEPQFRAIDFDHKLETFLSLRNIDPVNE
ncbi:adenylate kinase 9 isoform X6 [Rousettus aegyptiacus]|uniref:adenylate kinase 9 isoform X6 n=1 Tax=Rousettus aegyptiacus TaxID=9407 RepID=UPI00168CC058|nr:adenylate kinase 9 isoform X6 [Rousettus aegyptiacus]